MGMVSRPDEIYNDPHVVASTHETLREHRAPPIVQPSREPVLAALTQP
jgi:hypothetical protein